MQIKISARAAGELRQWAEAADAEVKGASAIAGADAFLSQTERIRTRHVTVSVTPEIREWLTLGGDHSDPLTAAQILEEWVADWSLPAMAPHLTRRSALRLASELRQVYATACE